MSFWTARDRRRNRLSTITGAFVDQNQEAAFRNAVWPAWFKRSRTIVLLGSLAFLATGITDYYLIGLGGTSYALTIARLVVTGYGLAYVGYAGRLKDTRVADALLLGFLLLLASAFLSMVAARPSGLMFSAPACVLIVCVFCMMQMTRLEITAGGALYVSIGLPLVSVLAHQPTQIELAVTSVQLIVANLLGYFVCARRHEEAREIWLHQEALRASEAQFQTLARLAPVGIFHADAFGKCIYISARLGQMVGLSPTAAMGDGWLHAVHPEDRTRVFGKWRDFVERGADPAIEFRCARPDGTVVWVSGDAQKDFGQDGKLRGFVGTLVDITEKTKALQALEQHARELESSNAELQQFAYVASHDLLEPLRTISTYSKLIAQRYQKNLDEDGKEFLGYVTEAAVRMHGLINDLLNFSNVDSQVRPFVSCQLGEIAAMVVGGLDGSLKDMQARVTIESLPEVEADPLQMIQLFQQLIGNAVKFRDQQAPVVAVRSRREGRRWVICVADNGIGIPKEYRQRIFELMKRLHTRDRYPAAALVCRPAAESWNVTGDASGLNRIRPADPCSALRCRRGIRSALKKPATLLDRRPVQFGVTAPTTNDDACSASYTTVVMPSSESSSTDNVGTAFGKSPVFSVSRNACPGCNSTNIGMTSMSSL